jgi:excisionase family DNA binding protein
MNSQHVEAAVPALQMAIEPLKSIKETAKILGISEKTLRDWVCRKKIDYVKSGDRVMFEPEAIRQFIARNRVKAQPREI